MMRLLTKNEIDARLAEEQRKRIDAGMAVAMKVDALRHQLADTQKRYETYRTEALTAIQKEIDAKAEELNAVELKLVDSRKEWERLQEQVLAPMEMQFASFVRDTKKKLSEEEKALISKRSDLEKQSFALNEQQKYLKKETKRLSEEEMALTKRLADAEKSLSAMKTAENEAELRRVEAQKGAEQAVKDAAKVRIQNEKERKELILERQKLEGYAKELDERELKLILEELKRSSPVQGLVPFDIISKQKNHG